MFAFVFVFMDSYPASLSNIRFVSPFGLEISLMSFNLTSKTKRIKGSSTIFFYLLTNEENLGRNHWHGVRKAVAIVYGGQLDGGGKQRRWENVAARHLCGLEGR